VPVIVLMVRARRIRRTLPPLPESAADRQD
jgi:hypothetical protein